MIRAIRYLPRVLLPRRARRIYTAGLPGEAWEAMKLAAKILDNSSRASSVSISR